ncbi:hypothetical protein M2323_003559 [Rhodoblastus acidophilus]|uniref:hypothetical protein n=1 Tax=Rhodoblastus acidophilus TaxID=1074 RepID=UPI002224FEB8|nr:hypothetical protein [Rhodoblastus acidophilus]MCW2285624.1 hypothetical protein [Rhodoblastus acidophilus]MCW2334618.1 hypothetical protein [Rhodoblastus acidophilus]
MSEPRSEPDVDPASEFAVIEMSQEGFADFLAALGESTPAPDMLEVARRPAPWEPGYTPRKSGQA